ncbi:hypothetical protein BRD01_07310 [Halobacteriales archaeon QS_8_65_32]|nr:MAG: hypothetical protein BRD01_07310 [Halobacteriales archaeon QS_8_65_32]
MVGVLSAIVVPVPLYLDAKKLAGYDGDLEWTPSPGLYGLLGFLFTGLAVLDYLYKRQGVIVDREDRSGWWVVALAGLALPIAILLVGSVLGGSSLGFAGIAFGVLFPIGLYKDAGYVRLKSTDWQPNPTAHLTYGLVTVVFGPLAFLYAGYYLYKRHAHVELR